MASDARRIELARRHLRQAAVECLRPCPASLERCSAHIQSAVAELRDVRRPGRDDFAALRKEIGVLKELLRAAGQFHQGWTSISCWTSTLRLSAEG